MFKVKDTIEIVGDSCFKGKTGKILNKQIVEGGSNIYWIKFSSEDVPYWFLESEIRSIEE